MARIFIDGSAGTTGLRIRERLAARTDITQILLDDSQRKDPAARRDALNSADIAFLCLPDAAAVEAVNLIELDNRHTVIIDTSTAHRVAAGWCYGFPELNGGRKREEIAASHRIANPGCHASGFLALTEPLVRAGLLPRDTALTCFSLTGYSGGGKQMIASYTADERPDALLAPRMYGLGQTHKHLPEMTAVSGLTVSPIFCPVVAPYYAGMEVTVPVFAQDLRGSAENVRELYRACYAGGLVRYCDSTELTGDAPGFLCANALAGKDCMEITVCGSAERILLIARFDNLGKGASGAAIQNMNLVLGIDEGTGLITV